MAMFKKNQPKSVLFLQTVHINGEKRLRGRVRILCSDVSGKVFVTAVTRSVYAKACENAAMMQDRRKPFVTIGLVNDTGKYTPVVIEISPEEAWALERILEHALKSGIIPDILKKYLKPMLTRGESSLEGPAEKTPKVLDRLPYYPPGEIEISVPIYKAHYSYPLIILKRLPPDEHTSRTDQKLLVLDSDGDLAAIRVPAKMVRRTEKEITDNGTRNRRSTCLLISRQPDGLTVTYMPVSPQQKKALEALAKYFDGADSQVKQPMPVAVRTVLTRAKDRVTTNL